MKKIIYFIILILLSCIQAYAVTDYSHLIKDYKFNCDSITYIEGTISYCERFINPGGIGKTSLVLVLHSGKEKGPEGKNLSAAAVKSLIDYSIKKGKKVLIIVPHYPNEPGEYSYLSNALVMRIVKDKVEKYSIPKDKIYIIVSFVNEYPDEILKNINVYYIVGDKDEKNFNAFKSSITNLKSNKNIVSKYKCLKNKNHLETINSAYTDDAWDWLFDNNSATKEKNTPDHKIFIIISVCIGIILLLLLLYKIATHTWRKES